MQFISSSQWTAELRSRVKPSLTFHLWHSQHTLCLLNPNLAEQFVRPNSAEVIMEMFDDSVDPPV